MEIIPNTLPTPTGNIQAADAVSNQTKTDEIPPPEETAVFDQVDLSDASKMLSTALRMANEGNTEAQAFLESLQDGLVGTSIDQESLMEQAPEELIAAMESQGIDLKETLQTIVDYSESLPPAPPPPPIEEPSSTEATEVSVSTAAQPDNTEALQGTAEETGTDAGADEKAAGAQKSGGGAAAASSASDASIEQQIEQLKERIKELQQEIKQLMGKDQTDETRTELNSRQAELSQATSELTVLESEASESEE